MADVRVSPNTVITDGTVSTQVATVDSLGRLYVSVQQDATKVADLSTIKAPLTEIAGWDDFVVRTARVEVVDGRQVLLTHDPVIRRTLTDILLQLIDQNDSAEIQKFLEITLNEPDGYSVFRLLSAATTNANLVSPAKCQVNGWYMYNSAAAVRYLKLYNIPTSPKVGTDVPVMTIGIPAGAAANVEYRRGIDFNNGLALAMTTGVADSDTAALTANDLILNLLWDSPSS